jgi:DNA-3-methyladenine glycosylase I
MTKKRCQWVENTFEEYIRYHDEEWGVPVHDDQKLFEFLILEGAQAGLSWSTILKKREGYRSAFANFEIEKVAEFSSERIKNLKENTGIVRNKLKIESAVINARQFLTVQNEYGSFSNYLWGFTDNKIIHGHWSTLREVPASTTLSDKISKDLKKRGFKFVGTTIIYAYLQAMGVVNDHTRDCFRYKELL